MTTVEFRTRILWIAINLIAYLPLWILCIPVQFMLKPEKRFWHKHARYISSQIDKL